MREWQRFRVYGLSGKNSKNTGARENMKGMWWWSGKNNANKKQLWKSKYLRKLERTSIGNRTWELSSLFNTIDYLTVCLEKRVTIIFQIQNSQY